MATERHASVWDAIEETPAAAETLRIRVAPVAELVAYLQRSGMTQAQAALQLGVTRPRISDLIRGETALFRIDTLVSMITAAGLHLDLRALSEGVGAGRGGAYLVGEHAGHLGHAELLRERLDARTGT